MHTFLSRANACLAYAFTVLAVATFCCFATTCFVRYDADVIVTEASGRISQDYITGLGKVEEARIFTNLESDLEPLFNWNAKQLFVYLLAEYRSPDNGFNQVVLWDKIIRRGENALLRYARVMQEYRFLDERQSLRANPNITLYLSWNVIPNAGLLRNIPADNKISFSTSDEYSKRH